MYLFYVVIFFPFFFFLTSIRIVRPTGRWLVERLGKYHHLALPCFIWIIPAMANGAATGVKMR